MDCTKQYFSSEYNVNWNYILIEKHKIQIMKKKYKKDNDNKFSNSKSQKL